MFLKRSLLIENLLIIILDFLQSLVFKKVYGFKDNLLKGLI